MIAVIAERRNTERYIERAMKKAFVLIAGLGLVAAVFALNRLNPSDAERSLLHIAAEDPDLPGVAECRGYVQHWWGQGNPIPERSAQRILKTADQILKAGTSEGGR